MFTKSTVFKGFNLSIERSSNLLICLNYSLESFKVFHCSVFNVLFRCRSLLSATAHLYYHAVSCLSTTFLFLCLICKMLTSKASLSSEIYPYCLSTFQYINCSEISNSMRLTNQLDYNNTLIASCQ